MAQRRGRLMDWDPSTIEIIPPDAKVAASLPVGGGLEEEEMVRVIIDRTFKPKKPAAKDQSVAAQLARDLEFIKSVGGTVEIPPGIAGE